MAWLIPNMCLWEELLSPAQTEGTGATAWSFQVFVCLSQNIQIQSKNKLQLTCTAFPWEQTLIAGCCMSSMHNSQGLPSPQPPGSLWSDTQIQVPARLAAAIRKEQSLQELPDVAPVHTHGWHLGAAVLVEFVAARLTAEAVEQELLADVTEGKLQKCLPSLENTASD